MRHQVIDLDLLALDAADRRRGERNDRPRLVVQQRDGVRRQFTRRGTRERGSNRVTVSVPRTCT